MGTYLAVVDHPELAREEVVELESQLLRHCFVVVLWLAGYVCMHASKGRRRVNRVISLQAPFALWVKVLGREHTHGVARTVGVQPVLEGERDAHPDVERAGHLINGFFLCGWMR